MLDDLDLHFMSSHPGWTGGVSSRSDFPKARRDHARVPRTKHSSQVLAIGPGSDRSRPAAGRGLTAYCRKSSRSGGRRHAQPSTGRQRRCVTTSVGAVGCTYICPHPSPDHYRFVEMRSSGDCLIHNAETLATLGIHRHLIIGEPTHRVSMFCRLVRVTLKLSDAVACKENGLESGGPTAPT